MFEAAIKENATAIPSPQSEFHFCFGGNSLASKIHSYVVFSQELDAQIQINLQFLEEFLEFARDFGPIYFQSQVALELQW